MKRGRGRRRGTVGAPFESETGTVDPTEGPTSNGGLTPESYPVERKGFYKVPRLSFSAPLLSECRYQSGSFADQVRGSPDGTWVGTDQRGEGTRVTAEEFGFVPVLDGGCFKVPVSVLYSRWTW